MLLPQRIVLMIALMTLGGFAFLSPRAWAGSKPHRHQGQMHARRLHVLHPDSDQNKIQTIVDDYCPPKITTDLIPKSGIVTITSTTPSPSPPPSQCKIHVMGLSLYVVKTAGPDSTSISRLQGLKVIASRPMESRYGKQILKFTIPLGPYRSLVGKTNLLLKIQYTQGMSPQLHTVYTTVLLTTYSHNAH